MFAGQMQLISARRDRFNQQNRTQSQASHSSKKTATPAQPEKVFYYGTTQEKAETLQATRQLPETSQNAQVVPVSGLKTVAKASAMMASVESRFIHWVNGESGQHQDQPAVVEFRGPAESVQKCEPRYTTMPALGVTIHHFQPEELKVKDYGSDGTHSFVTQKGLQTFEVKTEVVGRK